MISEYRSPNRSRCAARPAPLFEALEERRLLDGVSHVPEFVTALTNLYFTTDGAITIGIDATDQDGDAVTVSAASDDPNVQLYIPTGNRYARMHYVDSTGADIGDIVVQLFEDRSPLATQRFITLSTNAVNADGSLNPAGTPFYSNVVVHRVIPGFMIQTGDAQLGNGQGGSPLGDFDDQFDPVLSLAGRGVLALANGGEDTNDSQFFITDGPAHWLNQKHTIFGQIISGYSVLSTIINLPRDENDRPTDPPKLQRVDIVQDNQDATLTIRPLNGFAGEANITVTLTDANNNTRQQSFKVSVLGMDTVADVVLQPGQSTSFSAPSRGHEGQQVEYSISGAYPGASATVNSATGLVDIAVPVGFTGAFQVTLSVERIQTDTTPVARVFHVITRNAADPPVLGGAGTNSAGEALGSFLAGDRLYVVSDQKGLEIFDLSTPSNPVRIGWYDTSGRAMDVEVVGTTAYVADFAEGLVALDVSDPGNIRKLDSATIGSIAISLSIVGNTAFVASYQSGLAAYDISNPSDIRELDRLRDLTGGSTMNYVMGVAVRGAYAYLTDWAGLGYVVDVSDPANMRFVRAFLAGSEPWGIDIGGETMYIADGAGGMIAFSLASPTAPKAIGSVAIANSPQQVRVAGQMAVVGATQGFAFVDVSNPAAPVVEYTFQLPAAAPNGMTATAGLIPAFSGERLALPMGANGVLVMDVTQYVHRRIIHTRETVDLGGGATATIAISGGGTVRLTTAGIGGGAIELLEVVGPAPSTKVTLTPARGTEMTVGDVVVIGSMNTFTAPAVNLLGDFTVHGSLNKLILGDVADAHTIRLHSNAQLPIAGTPVTLIFDRLAETDLVNADVPIKSLTASEWLDNDGIDNTVQAPWIGTLTIRGDFEPNLTLSGAARSSAAQPTLKTANIAGAINDGTWQIISGGVGAVKAGGAGILWTLQAGEGVKTLQVLGDLAGILSAGWFGAIKVGGDLSASLTATASDAKGVSFGSIQAGTVTAVVVDAAVAINSIRTAQWSGGSIEALWLTSLNVAGSFEADLYLNHDNSSLGRPTLGSAKVGGEAAGDWDIRGNSGGIRAGATAASWNAEVTGAAAGLTVAGQLSGAWSSGTLKSLSVGGNAVNASLSFTQLANAATPNAMTLGRMTVKGWMDGVSVRSAGSIGSVTAGGLRNSTVFAGVTSTSDLQGTGDDDGLGDGVWDLPTLPTPQNPGLIDALARIKTLTVKGIKQDGQYVASLINSSIAGGSLENISLCYATFSNGGLPFGLTGLSLTKLGYKDGTGSYRWPAWPAEVGSFEVRLPA